MIIKNIFTIPFMQGILPHVCKICRVLQAWMAAKATCMHAHQMQMSPNKGPTRGDLMSAKIHETLNHQMGT